MQEHKSFLIKDLLSDVLNGTHNEGKQSFFGFTYFYFSYFQRNAYCSEKALSIINTYCFLWDNKFR